jgi:hypothetical protein
MASLLFQRSGVVLDGSYLPGLHRFTRPKRLLSAELSCQPPSAGTLRLELEIAGVLTGLAFAVPASSCEVRQSMALGVEVEANQSVRWLASFDGTPAQAATEVAITVGVGQAFTWPVVRGQVVWTDGSATVPLYVCSNGAYVPLTAQRFTRASMTSDGSMVWLDGTLVLSVAGGELLSRGWREGALGATGSRLEFWLGRQRVAVLNAQAMHVRQLREGPPSGGGYTFASGGILAAVLDTTGLTATGLVETNG